MANHELHFFAENEERSRISCTHCGDYADDGNEDGDELVFVEPETFCEYFGVEEDGPRKA